MVIVCLFIQQMVKGSDHLSNKKSGTATISVHLNESNGDTILFYVYKDAHESELEQKPAIAIVNRNSFVIFRTSTISVKGVRIAVFNQTKNFQEITDMGAIIEAGDHINIRQIKNAGIIVNRYTGKGSEKFVCLQRMIIYREAANIKRERQKATGQFYTLNNLRLFCSVLQYRKEVDILESFKKRMSFLAYETMLADIIGRHHYISIYELVNLYARADSLKKLEVVNLFHNAFKQRFYDPLGVIPNSSIYLKYLFDKSYKQVVFTKGSYNISILDLYRQIVKDYEGAVREQVVFRLLFSGSGLARSLSTQTLDSIWQQALLLTHNPSLRSFIEKRISHKEKGQSVCDLPLSDTNSQQIKLNQFTGKVMLIDVWFTGCVGCMNYSRRLETEIYPYYENNPGVIFVSINGDINKNEWLKSLRKGKYTRQTNLNLNTNGMGFSDPFTIYYDIGGGPNSLLVGKNGKIFSGSPPLQDMKQLKSLVDEALLQ
jgi:hypothetical protein